MYLLKMALRTRHECKPSDGVEEMVQLMVGGDFGRRRAEGEHRRQEAGGRTWKEKPR
jgi:hypothetical protein